MRQSRELQGNEMQDAKRERIDFEGLEEGPAKPKRKSWGDPGSKVARRTAATVFSAGAQRPVVVAVYPNGTIGLRLLKSRREEFIFANDAYRDAVIARKLYERAQRKKKGKR